MLSVWRAVLAAEGAGQFSIPEVSPSRGSRLPKKLRTVLRGAAAVHDGKKKQANKQTKQVAISLHTFYYYVNHESMFFSERLLSSLFCVNCFFFFLVLPARQIRQHWLAGNT